MAALRHWITYLLRGSWINITVVGSGFPALWRQDTRTFGSWHVTGPRRSEVGQWWLASATWHRAALRQRSNARWCDGGWCDKYTSTQMVKCECVWGVGCGVWCVV